MIGDTISFMPSSLCKTENLSITTERPAWSKFLTKKVNQKRQQNYENQVLKKELRLKQKTLSTYEYLLKLPAEQGSEFYKCKQCPKFFISKKYL